MIRQEGAAQRNLELTDTKNIIIAVMRAEDATVKGYAHTPAAKIGFRRSADASSLMQSIRRLFLNALVCVLRASVMLSSFIKKGFKSQSALEYCMTNSSKTSRRSRPESL